MKSRIFSVICACALALTTFSSFVVAEASAPDIKYSLNFSSTGELLSDENYDPDLNYEDYYGAPVYKAEFTLKGAKKKASVKENGATVAYTGCFVDSIQAKFQYSSSQSITLIAQSLFSDAALSKTSVPGEVTFSWSTADSNKFLKADTVVATWYFIADDKTDITDFAIKGYPGYKSVVQVNQYWDGTSKDAQTAVQLNDISIEEYPSTPAPSEKDAVKGKTINGSQMFSTSEAITMPEGVDDVTVTITNDKVTDKTIEETVGKNTNVLGSGTTKFIPIVSYKIGDTSLKGSIFTIKVTNGSSNLGTWTYTVPTE